MNNLTNSNDHIQQPPSITFNDQIIKKKKKKSQQDDKILYVFCLFYIKLLKISERQTPLTLQPND